MITLTIAVDDNEFAGLLADAIARGSLAGAGMIPQPVVTQPVTGPPADPWADQEQGWPQGAQTAPGAPLTAPQTYPATSTQAPGQPVSQAPVPPANFQPASPAQGTVPMCQHGPMKFVPGGFSKKTGRPYPPFWACQAGRGVPQCKGQEA